MDLFTSSVIPMTISGAETYFFWHGVTLLDIDLNWGNKNSRLSVTVYTPTGGSSGTYYDTSDGLRNGRIVLRIKPKSGKKYLQEGSWKFKVYGESVRGTEDYTFKADAHL